MRSDNKVNIILYRKSLHGCMVKEFKGDKFEGAMSLEAVKVLMC